MEVQFGVSLGYFLWSLLIGCVLAFFYDLFRTARRIFHTSIWVVNLEDIFFLILSGLLLVWTAYEKNSGRLRWQGFFGAGLSFFMYRRYVKEHMVCFLSKLYEKIVEGVLLLIRILLFPLRIVYRVLSKPFYVIVWYSKKRVRRAENIVKTKRKQREMRRKCKQSERKKKRRKKAAGRQRISEKNQKRTGERKSQN